MELKKELQKARKNGVKIGRRQVLKEFSNFVPICPFCKNEVKKEEEMMAVHTRCIKKIKSKR